MTATIAAIRPPRLRPAEHTTEERHASWLELFFDLVFVAAVAQLSHLLQEDHSPAGFLRLGALFVPVFWAWMGYTFYADRFDTDDLVFRLSMMAAMLAISALAVSLHDAFTGGSARLAVAYIAARVILIAMYDRARRHVPAARELCRFYMTGFTIAAAFWVVSLFVPVPERYALWAVGMAIDLSVPLLAGSMIRRTPFHASHIPERFGLFTLIVLGESVAIVATGTADAHWQAPSVVAAVACFVAVACLWWIYFDFVDTSVMRRGLLAGQTYVYSHLAILIALTTSAAGAALVIHEAAGAHGMDGGGDPGARVALSGGVALYLVAISAIHLVTVPSFRDAARDIAGRIAVAVLAIAVAAFGGLLPGPVLASVLAAALAIQTTYEISRGRRPAHTAE